MPIGNYAWMTEEELAAKDWTKYDENGTTDCIVECDLDYSSDLHLSHSSLPLAPHVMKVDQDMMSPFMKEVLMDCRKTDRHESTKLMSTLLPKTKYTCHSANLSLYLSLGMRLVKVHRALKFTTSKFLEQYITYCTQKRKAATTDFRKRLFKAFSNSNFGKVKE